jgi:hypothetical protein
VTVVTPQATRPFPSWRIKLPIARKSRLLAAYEICRGRGIVPHQTDRRRTRVTIQDLRRDLRQADEDRFLLAMRGSDPRHSWIGVQDVRRHLREADEDRFRLTRQVQSQATLIKRGSIAMLLLLIAGSGIAFRNADRPMPAPPVVKAVVPTTTPGVVLGERPVEEMLPPTPTVTTGSPDPKPVTPARRLPAKSHTNRPVPAQAPEPPRRVTPRPLHPGEFGRRVASQL